MASNSVQVKARFGDELRKISLSTASFSALVEKLKATFFASDSAASFRVTYLDADGDEVTISSDEELGDAFLQISEQSPVLRVTVNLNEQSRSSSPIVVAPSSEIASISSEEDNFETVELTDAAIEPVHVTPQVDTVEEIQVVATEAPTETALPVHVTAAEVTEVEQTETAPATAADTEEPAAWLQALLSSDLVHVVQTRDVAIGLYLALPVLLSRVLDNSSKLTAFLSSPQFLEKHLPVLLNEFVLKAPTLAAALARAEFDAALVAHVPAAAEALRAFLGANQSAWKATADALAAVRVYSVNSVRLLYRLAAALPAEAGTALLRWFIAGESESESEQEEEEQAAEAQEAPKQAEPQPSQTYIRRIWDWENGVWRTEEYTVPAAPQQQQQQSRCSGAQQTRCGAAQQARCEQQQRRCGGAQSRCEQRQQQQQQQRSCGREACCEQSDSDEEQEQEQTPRFVWRVVRRPVFAYRRPVFRPAPWGFRSLFAF